MVLKFNLKKFIISILIPIFAGGLSALITNNFSDVYSQFKNPPYSPPSWVFPLAWSILYILMGISLYLVWNNNETGSKKQCAFIFFGLQLALNFIWSPIFFLAQNFLLAFIIIGFMMIFTLGMIVTFYNVSKAAGVLQIPYLLWLVFAAYLNYGVYLLN